MSEQIMWAVKHHTAGFVVIAPSEESAWTRAARLYNASEGLLKQTAISGFSMVCVRIMEVQDGA